MLTVDELALFLRTSATRTRAELTETTKHFIEGVAKDARDLIGQEREEWKALAPSTVTEKQKLGFTGKVSATDPLLREGDLRESIRGAAEATADGAVGVVGSSSKIALYQEIGTARIPPRPFTAPALIHSEKKAGQHYGELGVQLLNPPLR